MILSVSDINQHLRALISTDDILSSVYVRGELSNFKLHSSGHAYMTMKDEGGVLRAVMFRSSAARLKFRPDNGMKVIAHGRVDVFARDGQYQLYIDELIPDGVGALYIAFEQLKEKLGAEGLFDPAYKNRFRAVPCALRSSRPQPARRCATCCASCGRAGRSRGYGFIPCACRGRRRREKSAKGSRL